MGAYLHLVDDLDDLPLCVDDKGDASGASPEEEFLTPSAIAILQRMGRVGDEWEGNIVFLPKLLVGGEGVAAHTYHFVALFLELAITLAEALGLLGAVGGVVVGIEIKDELAALVVTAFEGYLLPAGCDGLGLESRCLVAYLEVVVGLARDQNRWSDQQEYHSTYE